MSGFEIQTTFASAVASLLSNDFSGGLGGFVGGTVANLVGFGEVLQLGPGEMTQATFAVPEGATTATLTFDMLGIDDLSGEGASIMINGAGGRVLRRQPRHHHHPGHGHPGRHGVGQPAVFERSHGGGQPRP
jgi:hypothetical protein